MSRHKYSHIRNYRGRHFVYGSQIAGPVRIAVDFEARKNGALYLRINNVLVDTQYKSGNLSAKIAFARELIRSCEEDAGQLRNVIERGIATQERKSRAANEQVQLAGTRTQVLCNITTADIDTLVR